MRPAPRRGDRVGCSKTSLARYVREHDSSYHPTQPLAATNCVEMVFHLRLKSRVELPRAMCCSAASSACPPSLSFSRIEPHRVHRREFLRYLIPLSMTSDPCPDERDGDALAKTRHSSDRLHLDSRELYRISMFAHLQDLAAVKAWLSLTCSNTLVHRVDTLIPTLKVRVQYT